MALNVSRDGLSTTPLNNLCQCFTTPVYSSCSVFCTFFTESLVKCWPRLLRAVLESPYLEGFKDAIYMWHLGTWVSGGLGSAGLKIGLNLRGLVQPKWFCESRLSWLVMPGMTQAPPCISQWVNWIHTAKFLVEANLETSEHLNLKKQVHGCGKNKTLGLMLGTQITHELQDTSLYQKCLFWGGRESKPSDLSLKFHLKFSFPVCYKIGSTFYTLLATSVQSVWVGLWSDLPFFVQNISW